MNGMMFWLDGKKTYFIAAVIVLSAATSWLTGELTLADALTRALEGLGLASLRAGVAKV
jgi:hypothetical protein